MIVNLKIKKQQKKFSNKKNKGLLFDKCSESKIAYVNKLLTFIDVKLLPSLNIVINSGNGALVPPLIISKKIIKKIKI